VGHKVGNTEGNSGEIREPVIVVSDVHLGREDSNYRDFWDFLYWLKLIANSTSLDCNGTKINIKKPGTNVLLGDILELWDTRKDDRNYVIKDVLAPISILNDIDCDIIYVIGNHDADLYDIKKVWGEEGVKFPYKGEGTFKIFYRTYPEPESPDGRHKKEIVKGIKIGNDKYVFLHGHQFDKTQHFHRISKCLSDVLMRFNKIFRLKDKVEKVRFDPIDWFQDLANVSFTKNVGRKLGNTLIFGLLFLLYILFTFILVRDRNELNAWFISGCVICWVLFSSFLVVTILPKIATWLFTVYYRINPCNIIPECTPVKEVVRERYAAKKGKNIDANIIVFGHTHNAGYCKKVSTSKEFINTGCWLKLKDNCKKKGGVPNTFLYINKVAPYLLIWDKEKVDKGEIECVKDFREVLS